jgi:DNA gyrase subunit B
MHELIERGHVYIAQPPLYKVKKGKQEQYLKDDADLNQYLLQAALDNAELFVSPEAPPLMGVPLETLARQFNGVMATVKRLTKRYDEDVLQRLIYMPKVDRDMVENPESMAGWVEELTGRLNTEKSVSRSFELKQVDAGEEQPAGILISRKVHGIGYDTLLPYDFFISSDYQRISDLGAQLDGLLGEGAYVKRGEKRLDVDSFARAMNWLIDEAKRGQHIQRYKGLGEMNPEQLWETTMNPDTRRLLKVNIEDAVGADEMFTTLMGDQVEPRREFIEKNALTVENLDV